MKHHDQRATPSFEREQPPSDAAGDACHPVSIHRRGRVLLILLLIIEGCNTAPSPEDVLVTTVTPSGDHAGPIVSEPVKRRSHGTAVFREPVNAFEVVEEEADVWTVHMPTRWIHLSFDTPDRHVNVTLTDDGATLYVDATSSVCSSSVHPLQYEGNEEESDLYVTMATALKGIVDSCGARLEGAARYLELLERAKPGFPEAVRVMKARVTQAFGRDLERCRLPEPDEFRDPNHPCS